LKKASYLDETEWKPE